MKVFSLILFVLLSQINFCQTTAQKLLHGKILVESGNPGGVSIINLVNEKSTVSDNNGEFSILAKAEDLLVFSAVNLEYHRRTIEDNDLTSDTLLIKMIPKSIELKEVIVTKRVEISAVSLGISPKGIKQYTPAERKLKTAGDFKPIHLLGLLGSTLDVDPILNAVSGRTTMLKKELAVEKKDLLLKQLNNMYDENYFVNRLKIPLEHIKGFGYYIIENEKFTTALKSKNKAITKFLMGELAVKYNEMISVKK